MDYVFHLLIIFSVYAVLAQSLNLVTGYLGYLSLAHSIFFAIGCYAYAITTRMYDWSFIGALILAISLGAAISLALSIPALRLRGDYFVLVSIAAQVLILSTLRNWGPSDAPLGSFQNLTNGAVGIRAIPPPAILGIQFDTNATISVLALGLLTTSSLLARRLGKSPWARALMALRDDELVARGLGKRAGLLKIQVFGISAGLASAAGVVYASYVRYVDPSTASLDRAVLILSMVIIGGLGNWYGPALGAAVLVALPEVLRIIAIPAYYASEVRVLAYGLLLLIIVHAVPTGVAGSYRVE